VFHGDLRAGTRVVVPEYRAIEKAMSTGSLVALVAVVARLSQKQKAEVHEITVTQKELQPAREPNRSG
jgi:hypothetical protein